jgi:hypothetical protein
MRAITLHIAIALALIVGTIAYAAVAAHHGARPAHASGHKGGAHLKAKGGVGGLYPGATMPMKVKVTNKYPGSVKLATVKTKVGPANPGCTGSNLLFKRTIHTHKKVKAHHKKVLTIMVTMAPNAPDACQGASFPLHFKVKGKGK